MDTLTDPASDDYKYWAFISYSHRDDIFARRLHRELETYSLPKKLIGRAVAAGKVPRRLAPIFLDRDELPGSPDLSEQIRLALNRARFLVVICSPAAAKSRYVREEIVDFKSMGRGDRVLAIIAAGEPNSPTPGEECFPDALRFRFDAGGAQIGAGAEPLACDARPAADGFRNAKLKLIAGICGVSFDELRQRDAERRLQRLRQLMAILLLIIGIISLLSVDLARQKKRAQSAEKHATSVLAVSDVREGIRLLDENMADQSLAFFSRAARTDPAAPRGSRMLASLLIQKAWFVRMFPDLRHEGAIFSARFSPDGTRILTSSLDKTARLWDAHTGRPLGAPMADSGDLVDAQFSPDGCHVITAATSLTLVVWDGITGAKTGISWKFSSPVRSCAFALGGDKLAVGLADGTVALENLHSPTQASRQVHESAVATMCFSPDGRLLATGSDDHRCLILDARTLEPLHPPIQHADRILQVAFSRDGKYLASAGRDGTVRIVSVADGQPAAADLPHDAPVDSVVFSGDGTQLLTACRDGEARAWNWRSGKLVFPPLHHTAPVDSAVFDPAGTRILTSSRSGIACIWDAQTGELLDEPIRHAQRINTAVFSPDGTQVLCASTDRNASVSRLLRAPQKNFVLHHSDSVRAVEFSPAGSLLAAGFDDGHLVVLDARNPAAAPLLTAELGARISSLVFSGDGKWLVAGCWNKIAYRWSLDRPAEAPRQFPADSRVQNVVLSPDGRWMAMVSRSTSLPVWDLTGSNSKPMVLSSPERIFAVAFSADSSLLGYGGASLTTLILHTGTWQAALAGEERRGIVSGIVFDPGGRFVATSSFDGRVVVRDLTTGHALYPPLEARSAVTDLVASPDGSCLATICANNSALLWDLKTGEQSGSVLRHRSAISVARFSPDNRMLATGSWDHTLQVWDVETGLAVEVPQLLPSRVNSLAYSSDGSQLAIGEHNGDLMIWNFPAQLNGTAEALARLRDGAKAISRFDLDRNGIVKPVDIDSRSLQWPAGAKPSDDYDRILKWLVDPAEANRPSPF